MSRCATMSPWGKAGWRHAVPSWPRPHERRHGDAVADALDDAVADALDDAVAERRDQSWILRWHADPDVPALADRRRDRRDPPRCRARRRLPHGGGRRR